MVGGGEEAHQQEPPIRIAMEDIARVIGIVKGNGLAERDEQAILSGPVPPVGILILAQREGGKGRMRCGIKKADADFILHAYPHGDVGAIRCPRGRENLAPRVKGPGRSISSLRGDLAKVRVWQAINRAQGREEECGQGLRLGSSAERPGELLREEGTEGRLPPAFDDVGAEFRDGASRCSPEGWRTIRLPPSIAINAAMRFSVAGWVEKRSETLEGTI